MFVIPSVSFADSSPCNKGSLPDALPSLFPFCFKSNVTLADRRGRRSLQFISFHEYHQFTLIETLLETDRRGLGTPQKHKCFRGPHDTGRLQLLFLYVESVTLILSLLSRTVGDLVSPKNASIFREPMVPTVVIVS